MSKIGIIGGSGLDDPDILERPSEVSIDTPYGDPSSNIKEGKISGQNVAILSRHGVDHSISPSNVNFRANIWALKKIGCTHILASTAVGSLRKAIEPGHIVFPNQFIDFTKQRISTFYDEDKVVHTPMAEPFCLSTIEILRKTAIEMKIPHHVNKTIVTIEGPRFSTKSESHMFRSWGADIINMSSCPEVALAKEQKIHYAALAMSTDYDSWKEDEEPVSWELIEKTMKKNAANVLAIFVKAIPKLTNWQDKCSP
jgi:5'-methylthioadenosine phosphorylase